MIIRAKDLASAELSRIGMAFNTLDAQATKSARSQIAHGTALAGVGAAMGLAGAAALAFYGSSAKAAMEYNRESALTLTQVDQLGVKLSDIEDIGKRVARAIPAPFKEMQSSLYDIFSSMEVNVKEAEQLLAAHARAAVAGQTSIQTAGRATIAIMNAFKIPAQDVNKVLDVQFQTVRKGVITYDELATTIGRAIPSAVKAGASIEELGAAMAFSTRMGLSAAMSATSVARAYDLLSNPKFAESMREFGISVTDAEGNFRPMLDVVTDLRNRFTALGYTEEEIAAKLKELTLGAGGTIQAMRFLNLAVQDSGGLFKTLSDDVHNSAGAFDEAYKIMSQTPAAKIQELKNAWEILRVEVGDRVLPIFGALAAGTKRIIDWFLNLDDTTKDLIVRLGFVVAVVTTALGILTLLGGAVQVLAGFFTLLGPAIAPILGSLAGWLAVGNAIHFLATETTIFQTAAEKIGQLFKNEIIPALKDFKSEWDNLDPKIKEAIKLFTGLLSVFAGGSFIIGKVIVVVKALIAVIGALVAAVTAPAALIAIAVAAIVTAFIIAYQKMEGFRNFIDGLWQDTQGVWDAISDAGVSLWHTMQDVWDGITDAIVTAWQAINGVWQAMVDAGHAVVSAFKTAWGAIRGAVQTAWNAIQSVWQDIQGAWDDLLGALSTGGDGIASAWQSLKDAASAVWDGIQDAWDGLVSAFRTGVDAIQAAFKFLAGVVATIWGAIQTAISAAWGVIKPVWDAMYGVIHDILTPVFIFLKAVVMDVWDIIRNTIGAAWVAISVVFEEFVASIQNGLIVSFNFLKEVATTVWNAIGAAIDASWQFIQGVWNAIVTFIQSVLSTAFTFMQQTAETVWNAITNAVNVAWQAIQAVWNAIVAFIQGVLSVAFNFMRTTAETVWNAISTVISTVWNSGILPVWNAITNFLDTTMTVSWNLFKDTGNTVWNAIRSVIDTVWGAIKPVWEAIVGFLDNTLTGAFNTFKGVVEGVWRTFESAARTAWDAVGNIIGGALRTIGSLVSGFFRVVAKIAGVVGLNHIADALNQGADAASGWGRESGGLVDAFMPVGPGFKTRGAVAIVGEGNPNYPEYVIPTDPKYRSRAMDLFQQAGKTLVGNPNTQALEEGGVLGTVVEFGKDVIGGAADVITDVVDWTVDKIRELGRAGLEKIWPKLGVPNNLAGIPPAGINSLREKVLDLIHENTPPPSDAGGGGGGGSAAVGGLTAAAQAMVNAVLSRFPDQTFTSGYRSPEENARVGGAPNSDHLYGRAADFAPGSNALANYLYSYPGIKQVLWQVAGHYDHVHGAVYDDGGILQRGLSMVSNGTGKPEAVFNWEQFQAIEWLMGHAEKVKEASDAAPVAGSMAGPVAELQGAATAITNLGGGGNLMAIGGRPGYAPSLGMMVETMQHTAGILQSNASTFDKVVSAHAGVSSVVGGVVSNLRMGNTDAAVGGAASIGATFGNRQGYGGSSGQSGTTTVISDGAFQFSITGSNPEQIAKQVEEKIRALIAEIRMR